MFRIFLCLLFVLALSCQKETDRLTPTPTPTPTPPTPQPPLPQPPNPVTPPTINLSLLYGWWISTGLDGLDWKRRYFGADSLYIEDRTNLLSAMSYRKWWPGNKDTIYVSLQENGQPVQYVVPPTTVIITKLTTDSLRISIGGPSKGYYRQ